MPISGEETGNFMGLKGENCTLLKVRGVKILEDEHGVDLLKIIRKGGSNASSDVEVTISNLLNRIDAVEKYLQNMPAPSAAAAIPGPKGPKGDDGEPGEMGPQGPRGASGAKKMAELTDVNLDGLDDGAILVWSAKEKKFVVSLE